MNVDELGEWIAEQAAHLDAATHRLLTAVREFDAANGWYKQGARTCAEWLSWRVGWSRQTARDRLRVAQRLGELPLVDDALRRGVLSYCKVRALTRVATPANEAALIEMAKCSTGAQLDRICRKYAAVQRQGAEPDPRYDAEQRYVSRRELDNGFVEITVRLHPEEGAAVWAALDRIVKERARAPVSAEPSPATEAAASAVAAAATSTVAAAAASKVSPGATFELGVSAGCQSSFGRADALVTLADAVLRGERPERSPIELVVTVAAETLRDPTGAGDPIGTMADGTCVSAETVRRLSCDCGVVPMIEDAHGAVLSVGRKTRSIAASIKRALLRRDRTCRFPGCECRLFLEGHHVEHWANGGETALSNLVGLCSHHHRYVHEYGYRMELDEAQQPRFFDPRGRCVVDVPTPPASSYRGWELVCEANRSLDINADTPACGWDGQPVEYDWVIDALVSVDRSPATAA